MVVHVSSNSSTQTDTHLTAFEEFLDPITKVCLDRLGVPGPGTRCLALGSGSRSVLSLLIERTGATGHVVAVDRGPSPPGPAPNIEIVQHDLQQGLPVKGPFGLVHARGLLAQLTNRRQLLHQLVAELTLGAWLVVGDFYFDQPLKVLRAGSAQNARLFYRVVDAAKECLVLGRGVELEWARNCRATMAALGLQRVKVSQHCGLWTGGDAGCALLSALVCQIHDDLLAAGIAGADMQHFYELMESPDFACSSWPFTYTVGQKPVMGTTIWVP